MISPREPDSRVHDLFGAGLGAIGAVLLVALRWQVDTGGPDPFHKGPLIYPLIVLTILAAAALPSAWRLARPPAGSGWRLDGAGLPRKPLRALVLLAGFLAALALLGLEIASLAFLAVALYTLGHRRAGTLILVPLVTTGLLVLIFKLFLDVYFPTPLLWDYFAG